MNTYKVTFDLSGCISHIGADVAGIGVENVSEWMHSDTLFSAIIHAYAKTQKKESFKRTNGLIEEFTNNATDPPFRCSSLFLANDKNMFVPKPKKPLPDNYDWSDLFKVKFISLQNLYKWLRIDAMDWNDETKCQRFARSVLRDSKTYNKLFFTRVRAVNAKDRLRNRTMVFHRGETIYNNGTQSYFFIDIQENYENDIKAAIQFLSEYGGFGGEINIGFSRMNSVKWEPFVFPASKGKNAYLLSLYPIYQNLEWSAAWYDMFYRKSWFNSPFVGAQLKKKAVTMLAEGSCLPELPGNGELLDVTPDAWENDMKEYENWHRIYRNGIGYMINY